MATVTFQIIDGVDKGRIYAHMETPVTLGREEGNVIRLNDERVSRFHAKVQEDHGQIVLTDLDSTNGTTINGEQVQLRLLRAGDQVIIGRSKLIFGAPEEIEAALRDPVNPAAVTIAGYDTANGAEGGDVAEFLLRELPKLPERLTPAQAAQLSEVVDALHRMLAEATQSVHIPAGSTEARLPLVDWQRVQLTLAALARYSRGIGDPATQSNRVET
jgi:predicted component of type VI protein secretion system